MLKPRFTALYLEIKPLKYTLGLQDENAKIAITQFLISDKNICVILHAGFFFSSPSTRGTVLTGLVEVVGSIPWCPKVTNLGGKRFKLHTT